MHNGTVFTDILILNVLSHGNYDNHLYDKLHYGFRIFSAVFLYERVTKAV